MDSQATTQLINVLIYILIPVVIGIFVLIGVMIYLYNKDKKQEASKEEPTKETMNTSNKQSIFNFMEFDTVEDNMIIQKKGNRYLMVIGCQGVNYDLMSKIEKNSVEEGFVQFLNSLRNPIQIYIQTRSVNLENNLHGYRQRVKEIQMKYENMKMQYEQMLDSEMYTEEQIAKAKFELAKQSNLYEYGISIIKETEKMSLNKKILNKNYYIIIPYYAAEAGSDKRDKEEIKSIAFSELYTTAQSLISSIATCGVRGKILRTDELIELLYMAYNREGAETFGVDRALRAGFNEIYSTAPDVYEKKMKELDKIIQERAIEKANEKIREARSEIQRKVEETEKNIDDIINETAKLFLEQNETYIGQDVKERALEKLDNTNEEGDSNGKKTRGRKKKTAV